MSPSNYENELSDIFRQSLCSCLQLLRVFLQHRSGHAWTSYRARFRSGVELGKRNRSVHQLPRWICRIVRVKHSVRRRAPESIIEAGTPNPAGRGRSGRPTGVKYILQQQI
jgi:hypothetical protein